METVQNTDESGNTFYEVRDADHVLAGYLLKTGTGWWAALPDGRPYVPVWNPESGVKWFEHQQKGTMKQALAGRHMEVWVAIRDSDTGEMLYDFTSAAGVGNGDEVIIKHRIGDVSFNIT